MSPSLRGRPFIEARWAARRRRSRASRRLFGDGPSSGTALHRGLEMRIDDIGPFLSPSLRGRPFIEACPRGRSSPHPPRVAAPERAALHRGGGNPNTALGQLTASPPLSGRPFIEARRGWCSSRSCTWSPPLSGRPFIEARRGWCSSRSCTWSPPLSGRPFIEAASMPGRDPARRESPPPSGRPFIEAPTTSPTMRRWSSPVAAPERAALHRGVS